MATLFASKTEEERRKLFLHVCLPVRVIVYTLTAILLILFPRIVGPILVLISIIGIIWLSYRSYTATGLVVTMASYFNMGYSWSYKCYFI